MSRAAARLFLLSRHRSSSTKLPHNPYYALPSLFHNEKPSPRFSTSHHNLSRSLFTFSFSSPFKPNPTMNPHNLYFSQTPTIINPINIIMRSYSAKAANPGSKDEKKGPKHASKKKKNNPKKSSSLAIGNRRTRFLKHRRGEIKGMKGTACQGNRVSFGSYALQALEPAWITSKQIEAGRKSMTRYAHRGGKIWIRVIPDKSVTGKPVEVRMGRGKGAVKYMAAVVKPGRVIYEISGVPENIAKEAITLAGSKMPIRTKFIRA